MSDHKAKAVGLIADVGRAIATFMKDVSTNKATAADAPFVAGLAGVNVAVAQVQATLYLAEQQRITNLLALAHTEQDETARGALWEEVGEGSSTHYVLRDDIAEGLGL